MCGFTLGGGGGGGGGGGRFLCALLFIAHISDHSSGLRLDSQDIRAYTWHDANKMADSVNDVDSVDNLRKHYNPNHKNHNYNYHPDADRLYTKNKHLEQSDGDEGDVIRGARVARVQSAKNVDTVDAPSRHRSVAVNDTSGEATLRVAYANDPFGGDPKHLHLRQRPREWTVEQDHRDIITASEGNKRTKRGVVQLYNMVNCATGCDPLIFKGYGCYCGFLGSGRPVDGIDKCCKMHDICYDVANCPMYLEYVVPYYWKCHRGKSLCAIDHLDLGGSGSCAQRLCECDRLLSECLSRFPCPRRRAKCVSSPWRLLQNTLMFF